MQDKKPLSLNENGPASSSGIHPAVGEGVRDSGDLEPLAEGSDLSSGAKTAQAWDFAMVCRIEDVGGRQLLRPAGPIESVDAANLRLFHEQRSPLARVCMLVPVDEVVRLAACAKAAREICDRQQRPYPEQLQALMKWLEARGWRA